MTDYVLEGPRWGIGAMGSSGGTLTWAMDGSVPASFQPIIAAAFADWSANGNISFQQVASTSGADITFRDAVLDGVGNEAGTASFSYDPTTNTILAPTSITFDASEGWHDSGNGVADNNGFSLFPIALHEIGHAIGLGHYTDAPAIMNPSIPSNVTDLTQSDKDGLHALYGLPGVITSQVPTTSPSPTGSNDNLTGSDGSDSASLLGGDDTYHGGGGADAISGNEGDDLIYGNQGNDQLLGNMGRDTLFGGQGDDYVRGGKDDDALFGDRGSDAVYGDLGNDVLHGGKSDDTVYGGKGDDILFGDLGNDLLIGGQGADGYVFGQNSGADTIEGFNRAEGDRLDIQGQGYAVGTATDGSALVTFSGGGTVELVGVVPDQVNAGVFATAQT